MSASRALIAPCARAPPVAAVCIAGAARTFPSPLVLTGLRTNFLKALGCPTRLFMLLKAADTPKLKGVQRMSFAQHRTSVDALRAALALPWLAHLIEEAAIINGSGSFSGTGRGVRAPPGAMVVASNETAWRAQRARRCVLSTYLATGTNEQRLILNHLGQSWCRDAIVRAEARMGHRFDLVAFTRPDFVWWRPLPSWCRWGSEPTLVSCNRSGCDMAWVAPRSYMGALFGQLEQHRECTESAVCCSTPEALLRHAKRVAFCRSRLLSGGRAREVRSGTVAAPVGSAAAAAAFRMCRASAVPRELDVFSTRPPLGSVLRSPAACELMGGFTPRERLSSYRDDPSAGVQVEAQRHDAVSAVTANELRLRFGAGNVSACRNALASVRGNPADAAIGLARQSHARPPPANVRES